MNKYYYEIMDYMKTITAIDTHCHHKPDTSFKNNFCLKDIITNSYCNWCGVEIGSTYESRKHFFSLVKNRTYFKWLVRSLCEIYNINNQLNDDTYEQFDEAIKKAYEADFNYHLKILRETCCYDKIILDATNPPGDDNGHPDIFSSTFRVDSFFTGFTPLLKDHDGNNCGQFFGKRFMDFDMFFKSLEDIIKEHHKKGAVSIKCAIAYDRGLDFEFVTKSQAKKVFDVKDDNYNQTDIKAFQDYVFLQVCKIAAELDIPLQVHTGLGKLYKSNANYLQPVIEANPDTRFVLFHGSYPWTGDIMGLVHVFPKNVFPDICWLPLVSTDAAIRMLSELIEVANAQSICWGCDTWTSEESYGALLAARHVIAKVLSGKIEDGYFGMRDAFDVAANIIRNNAKRIYRL